MSENTSNNKNAREDEIDLLDLFRRIGRTLNRWGRALGRALLISVVFLLKRWLPLGLSIALGIGVSYFFKTISASLYTSDLVLRTNSYVYHTKKELLKPNLISTSDLISYLNHLQLFGKENNTISLANEISASQDQIKNIVDISAFWIIDKGNDGIPDYVDYSNNQNVYDTVNVRMQDRLDIRVRIRTPQELTNVRNGIIRLINSDSLFQARNRLRLMQNQELVRRLNYDITQLDSLQKVKYFEETRNMKPKNGGQMIFMQEQKTQLVYPDIYILYARKQALETDLDLYKDIVTVLSDFTLPANRDNGIIYYGKNIIPVFFLITLFILILIANWKKLRQVYNKY
ncbi:MAG: hypothetical protein ABSF81_05480 [Bacteroidales bacterium]